MKNNLIPIHCPSCGSELKVEGIHLVCMNDGCKEQMILKILHWVTSREMEFFSESSIRSLFNAGKIKTIIDLYKLKENDFNGIEGFAEKKINNALEQIEKTKEMSIGKFCDALGIELVGEKAIKKLGIKDEKELLSFNDDKYVIGRNIIDYIKHNKKFVEELLSFIKIKKETQVQCNGKKICMTGTGPDTRNNLIKIIETNGDMFVDSINKETNVLLCEDKNGTSSKLVKARKLGITILNYSDYFKN